MATSTEFIQSEFAYLRYNTEESVKWQQGTRKKDERTVRSAVRWSFIDDSASRYESGPQKCTRRSVTKFSHVRTICDKQPGR